MALRRVPDVGTLLVVRAPHPEAAAGHLLLGTRAHVYFLRPAVEGGEGDLLYPEDLGAFWWAPAMLGCTFLRPTGCELPYEARPLECRALEPMPGGRGCKPRAGAKRERADEWRPYQAVVEAARAAVSTQPGEGSRR